MTDLEWLQRTSVALGVTASAISAEGVFRKAVSGLTYSDIGEMGAPLPSATPAGVAK